MVYEEKFWEEDYWSRFGTSVWALFKISVELLNILKEDECVPYVNTVIQLTKHIVEKLSEYVEIEEPEPPGARDAMLVTQFMRTLADFAIGKNPTVTLAWVFRNVTFEYVRASFNTIYEKPERFNYLASILDLKQVYQPPELLTGGEIDLSFYHLNGYLENPIIEPLVEPASGGRFKYILRIRDKPDFGKSGVGALIVRLGMLAWEILREKPGILAIFETVDARSLYFDLARSRIPARATEIVESLAIHVLGDGKIYRFREEKVEADGTITLTFVSDEYNMGVPIPKSCRNVVYEFKGPLVHAYEFCQETDLLFRENKYEVSGEAKKKMNVVEFLRGIQPYLFLGVWDMFYLGDKFILFSRI